VGVSTSPVGNPNTAMKPGKKEKASPLTRRLYAMEKLEDHEWDFSWIPEERLTKYVSGYELAREVVRQVLGADAFKRRRLRDVHKLLGLIMAHHDQLGPMEHPAPKSHGQIDPSPIFIPEAFEHVGGVRPGSKQLVRPSHELVEAFASFESEPGMDLGPCLVFHQPDVKPFATGGSLPNGIFNPPVNLSVVVSRPVGLSVRFGADLDEAVDVFRTWAIESGMFRVNRRGPKPSQELDVRHLSVYRFCQGRVDVGKGRYNIGKGARSQFPEACKGSSLAPARTKYGQGLQRDIQGKVQEEDDWSRSLHKADDIIAPLVGLCRRLWNGRRDDCK
jgi:hypothetical protein